MFTVKEVADVSFLSPPKFQNILCLWLSFISFLYYFSLFFISKHFMFTVKCNASVVVNYLGVFQNISCLQLRDDTIYNYYYDIDFKTFHVYG